MIINYDWISGNPEPASDGWQVGAEYSEGDGIHFQEGIERRTVVDIHTPGRFPPRVFYLRRWVAPDGYEFGKPFLRVLTLGSFKTWLANRKGPLNDKRAYMVLAREGGAAVRANPNGGDL